MNKQVTHHDYKGYKIKVEVYKGFFAKNWTIKASCRGVIDYKFTTYPYEEVDIESGKLNVIDKVKRVIDVVLNEEKQ